MLARTLPILALSCAVVSAHAHAGHHHFAPRQGGNSGSASASHSASQSHSAPAPGGSTTPPPPSGTVTQPSPTVAPVPGPSASDAVPLDQIVPVAVQPADTTTVAITTPTPGSKPASLPSAPALPDRELEPKFLVTLLTLMSFFVLLMPYHSQQLGRQAGWVPVT